MTTRKLIQQEIKNTGPVSVHGQKIAVLTETSFEKNWFILNLLLLALVASLIICYTFWSNFLTAGEYRENLFRAKLSEITAENNDLISQKSDAVNLGSLLVFSKQAGLVEQKNAEYIFDQSNLAQANLTGGGKSQ